MSNDTVFTKVEDFIVSSAEAAVYEVVDILTRGGRNFAIEIVLDKSGGITLDECVSFNRNVTSWIEDNGLYDNGFTVDVCSPGLDREIKTDRSFKWALGRNVEVRVHSPIEGKNVITGKMIEGGVSKDIKIDVENSGTIDIEGGNVSKVKLFVTV